MIGYRDRTFCTSYKECAVGQNCGRALTPEVKAQADIWWGKEGAPIWVYSEIPDCFIKKVDKQV